MSDEESNDKLNFVKNGVVYIHGDFDYSISSDVIPDFKKLIESQKKLKNGKIVIDINSPGGYISVLSDLLALVELAKKEDIIIETRSMAAAHSCGALLLMSGTKGHRYVSPLSYVLVHHATTYSRSSTDTQLQRDFDRHQHLNKIMRKIINNYADIPTKELNKMLDDDNYYVYDDKLIEFGIADKLAYEI